MTEYLTFTESSGERERYLDLEKVAADLFLKSDNLLSNLANLTAVLKSAFGKISWAGFYLFDGKGLYLGPFQGKLACTNIAMGKGVCGTAAQKLDTVIVEDVEKFPGHIACDPDSRSEIVLPVRNPDGSLFGVLDLDSREYGAFNETDKEGLEKLIKYFENNLITGRF